MAKKSFRCKVVTPTASLVDDAVTYASIPAWDGLFGVLPGRAPILARLGVGELRLEFADSSKGAGGERSFLIDGGFVQMAGEQLMVLAERALPVEQINAADAEAELKAAQSKTVAPDAPNKQAATAQLARERQVARTKVHMAKGKRGI